MRIKRQLASGSSLVAGRSIALMSDSDRNASLRQSVLDASCWNRAADVSIRTPVTSSRTPALMSAHGSLRALPDVPHRAGSFHVKQRQRRNQLYRRCGITPGFAGAAPSGSALYFVATSKSAPPGISRTSTLPSVPLPLRSAAGYPCLPDSRAVSERRAIEACTTATAYRWHVGEGGPGEQRKSLGAPERRSTPNASVSHAVLLFHVKRDHPRRTPSLRSAVFTLPRTTVADFCFT
jgi:hypothetical protein